MFELVLPPVVNTVAYSQIEKAAHATQSPAYGLFLIMLVENGEVGKCNASNDCGPMQVNTMHYTDLHKRFGLDADTIINTVEGNVLAGAIVLREKLNICLNKPNAHQHDIFYNIACYHNFKEPHRSRYRQKLVTWHEKIERTLPNG